MSVIQNNLLMTPEGYNISRSVRLRSSASAYFNRTPASTTNRQTWTWSGWVKRGALGGTVVLFGSSGANYDEFRIDGDKVRYFINGAVTADLTTSAVFRDPSAWYHIVLAVDTTQATSSNRIKMYVNGVQVTAFSTSSYPTQNTNGTINSNISHSIGYSISNASLYFDGYLTEINFIDGQALTPSSFGETDLITGVWKPKKYLGTYGTNGFFLNFSDNSAATATAIGKDMSGNANNWTPNNISVTAGVTYDSMLDVPTMWADGGNGRGNYAVLNPLQTGAYATQSHGNLTNTGNTATNSALVLGSIGSLTSGKWYWEYTQGTTGSETCGICTQDMSGVSLLNGEGIGSFGIGARHTGQVFGGAVGTITSWTTGDVIGLAVDCDNGAIYWSKNGTWLNSGVPTSGSSKTGAVGVWTPSSTKVITPAFGAYNGGFVNVTFGQRPFAYTPPTGFKALNTQNLPDSTIKKGNQYFDVSKWTGNGSSQSITNGGFQPDLVWAKDRTVSAIHILSDSVRGTLKHLSSNDTTAEASDDAVRSFDASGFTTGTWLNTSSDAFVGWQWKESVSAGFDIVTYTGNGSTQTISHSLGVVPKMMVVKKRSSTGNWPVYHVSLGNATSPFMNLTNAANSQPNLWNSTTPTSSVFSVGNDGESNASAATYVAYLFAEVAGYSKFGSYTGNGSTDGTFVYLGFRPRFILIKSSSAVQGWHIVDTARDTYNLAGQGLDPNTSSAEYTPASSGYPLDILSNGFKYRYASEPNVSGATYIYAAFAENPFKNSLAR